MKQFIVMLQLCLFASAAVTAQTVKQDAVPAPAKSSFTKAYPDASKVKWEKEHKDYEVSFVQQGKQMAALYDANGQLKETEVVIGTAELPKAASEYVNANYKGAAIKEATKITKAGGKVTYEAVVNKKDLLFDAAGKYMGVEKD
jgi:phage baseplate assembly protein gpV